MLLNKRFWTNCQWIYNEAIFKSLERTGLRIVFGSSFVPLSNGKKSFPGIDGLINIYDSFYVPSTVSEMEVSLHYNSSYDIFMSIGNKTVYQGNSSNQEATITLGNSYLSGIIDYASLKNKTIPVRIGFVNASYTYNITLPSDVSFLGNLTVVVVTSSVRGN